MSSPSIWMRPSTRARGTSSCIRFSVRMNVDFPQPDGPMSAVTCLGSISSVMSSIALRAPYHALTPWASIRFTSGSLLDSAAAREDTGEHGQDEDDTDQGHGAGPRPVDGGVEGGRGLGEH